jgi:hypothetical protein
MKGLPRVDGIWGDLLWGRLLFSANRNAIACTKERVEIAIENASVELWLQSCGPADSSHSPELVVLRLLGARGRAELATDDPARYLSSVSSVVATMNPAGFGTSRGTCTLSHYFAGILASYDSLSGRFPSAAIWVHGKSIGGLGALYVAATRSPRAIVIRNVVDVAGIAAERLGRGIRTMIPAALNAQRWATHARCPALFVISKADRFAIPSVQHDVADRYGSGLAEQLEVGGAHDDRELMGQDVPRYFEALVRLLTR